MPPAAWDRLSTHYERQLRLERVPLQVALDLLDARTCERLLDVGTGTGAVLHELARRPARPAEVLGVDASAAMLARVGALPSGWAVHEGDARRLPLADDSFDIAVAAYVLHVLPRADLPKALRELARVLPPGGRLVTVTPSLPRGGAARWLATAADGLARRHPGRYGGLRALDPRSALEQCGFTLVRARMTLRGYPSLCVLARAAASSSATAMASSDAP